MGGFKTYIEADDVDGRDDDDDVNANDDTFRFHEVWEIISYPPWGKLDTPDIFNSNS